MTNLLGNSQLHTYFEFKELVHTSIFRLISKTSVCFLHISSPNSSALPWNSFRAFWIPQKERFIQILVSLFWVIPSELDFHIWNATVFYSGKNWTQDGRPWREISTSVLVLFAVLYVSSSPLHDFNLQFLLGSASKTFPTAEKSVHTKYCWTNFT